METIYKQIMSPEVNLYGALFKLALSLVLGATIGMERGRKGHVAGMRTFALICMGATLSMLVSIFIPQEYLGLKNGDPGRIAAQVISGIGFLGAGAIIQQKGAVKGLTTAAGIWITAAIGLAIGAGMYLIPTLAVALILFTLNIAERYEHSFFKSGETKIVRIKTDGIVTELEPYRELFRECQFIVTNEFIRYEYVEERTVLNFTVLTKGQPDFVKLSKQIREIGQIRSITLTNEMNN